MKHLRFLSTNGPVCETPSLLGDDFLIVDYTGGDSCKLCLQLVVAYNAKVDRYDLTLASVPPVRSKQQEAAQAESSFVTGAMTASLVWLIIIAWLIWICM